MLQRFRPILAGVLAVLAAFVVGCSAPSEPMTYTQSQIEDIQLYAARLGDLRDRMDELGDAIDNEDWGEVDTFIHGPLGSLRERAARVTRQLLPSDRDRAEALAEDLFEHLEEIDRAADIEKASLAVSNYRESLQDFDAFLALVPESVD